jgi:hypothetical protein
MARRRHENGLKYQQRIQSEQLRDGGPEPPPQAPVPPGVTQLFENTAAPPFVTHEPHEPANPDEPTTR